MPTNKNFLTSLKTNVDWLLLVFIVPILAASLVTMRSFTGESHFFGKQLISLGICLVVFFAFSFVDFRFLRRTNILVATYLFFALLLVILQVVGHTANGATSWFSFGSFSFQPSDFMKLVLVLMLAKYFSRRHVEIAHSRHIFVSALYMLVPFALILLEPDFGSAMIVLLSWFGLALVSGISKKHLAIVFTAGLIAFSLLWFFGFKTYQKERILNFIHPLVNVQGSGYNAYQSTIAVGSGKIFGKGIGYGTQSRLKFLPEYQTDFIFAAFAEEWGFVGAVLLFLLYGLIIWRILANAYLGSTNFEILFGIGVAILFMSHLIINIGMNIGILPVTGIPLPLMSYGGSHLLAEFSALGILMGMRKYNRTTHRDNMKNEFLGI